MTEQWRAEYGPRAFQQDATQAMRGDMSRGLIELITNADDAYSGKAGSIRITIDHGEGNYPLLVAVTDSAKGLDFAGLKRAFSIIGALTSQSAEGKVSRGYLGRGAKDVAIFGAVKFEAIKDGKYSDITLFKNGNGRDGAQDITADESHYATLGLEPGESGLKATILCSSSDSVKNFNDLVKKLSTVSQLRDLIKRRAVQIIDRRQLMSETTLVSPLPQGVEVMRKKITLKGYEGEAELVVRKLHEIQPSQLNEHSAHGILVKSGISIFQNTWFTSNLKNRPAARWLAGEVEVPQILDVLNNELLAQSESDDFAELQLLSRTRDGLEKDHELMKALSSAIEEAVWELFEQLDATAESGQKQGENLTKDFNLAAQSMMRDFAEVLKELEDDMPVVGLNSQVSSLDVIPSLVVVAPGATVTLTLRADSNYATDKTKVTEAGPKKGLKLIGASFAQAYLGSWVEHDRLVGKKTDQITIEVPQVHGVFGVDVVLGSLTASAQIVVAESSARKKPVPQGLEFSPKIVHSAPGRGKNMLLRAPVEMADVKIDIMSEGVSVIDIPSSITLTPEPDGAWVEAVVHIRTGNESGDLRVTATSINESAIGTLRVEEASNSKGNTPRLSFELNGDKDPYDRYYLDKTGPGSYTVFIYGKHPLFNNVFGNFKDDSQGFAQEDTPEARAILSQVISHAFAQHLVELAYEKKPEGDWDAARTMYLFNSFVEKFVGKLHKALLK